MKEKSTTVRVSRRTKQVLDEIAAAEERPMTELIAEAVEQYRRRSMLKAINESFSRLKSDEKAWAEVTREREIFDATLMDGLEDEPYDGDF